MGFSDILRVTNYQRSRRRIDPFPHESTATMSKSSQSARANSPTVPMQVLCLGVSRTGTVSMQAALETLGCKPTYHGYTLLDNPAHVPLWTAAFEAKYYHRGDPFTRQDWDRLLGTYSAVTEIPSMCFAEELIDAYPEAKVVLVQRDLDTWYESFQGPTDLYYHPFTRLVKFLDPQLFGPLSRMLSYIYEDRNGFYRAGNKRELQRNAKTVYRDHYEWVRKVCPPERLLNFELKEGWGPLCAFLGKEEPGVPFPMLNERGALGERSEEFVKMVLRLVLRNVVLLVVSVGAAVCAVGWARRQWV